MMMRILALAGVLMVHSLTLPLHAQDSAAASGDKPRAAFEFHLARSLTDKNAIDKPASLQITDPDGKARTYAADLGFGLSYIPGVRPNERVQTEYGVSAEYHRNTVTDKEQNSLISGFSVAQQRGNLKTDDFVWFPTLMAKYKKDRVKGTESLIPAAEVRFAHRGIGAGFLHGPNTLGFLWEPKVGVEDERVVKAASGGPTGSVGRLYGNIDVGVYPLVTRLSERLELLATFREWKDFAKSAALDTGRDRHQLHKFSINYFFDEDKHYAVGVDRVSGENPSEGLPEQKYTQLAFKISF